VLFIPFCRAASDAVVAHCPLGPLSQYFNRRGGPLSALLLLISLRSPASNGTAGPLLYDWVYFLFEKDLEHPTNTCRPRVVPLHPPQCHESSSKLPMSTFLSLDGQFVSAEEALNGKYPVAIGSHSDDGSSVQCPDSHSSGILEVCASAAADAVLSVILPDGADDGGGLGGDGYGLVPAASQPDANKRRGGGAAGMGGRPEGTGARSRENFPRGSLLVLSEALYFRGLPILLDGPALGDVSLDDRMAFTELVASWRSAVRKEEV